MLKIKHIIWQIYNGRKSAKNFLFRKYKKAKRSFINNEKFKNSYTFAITCVKRDVYVKLIIKHINSLHYINPTHKFIIYCDNRCYNKILIKKKWLDYPAQTEFKNIYGMGEKPWQYYKIETVIDAGKNSFISVDADEIWYGDPEISNNKITFLVASAKFSNNTSENLLIEKLYKKEWTEFYHYNTGFLSIPSRFMTDKVADDIRNLFSKLFTNDLAFISDKNGAMESHRISEEIAINLAIQSNYLSDNITSLKNIDGPKNTNVIQSLYYGCNNRILD